jgi:hypothetical protein
VLECTSYIYKLYLLGFILRTSVAISGVGAAYPSGAPEFTPNFSGVRVTRSFVLCVCFVDRFFVLLSFLFWPMCCFLFFFNIQILITSLWYLQALLATLPYPHLLVYIVFLFNIYQLKNIQPLSGESKDYKIGFLLLLH